MPNILQKDPENGPKIRKGDPGKEETSKHPDS